jgi:UDP-galactopyranose mutase
MTNKAYPSLPDRNVYDLVCFSHLRWDFVYQRPQHLLSRFAKKNRVFFIEEPIFGDGPANLEVRRRADQLYTVVPHIPHGSDTQTTERSLERLLADLFETEKIKDFVAWYYTPMMLGWSRAAAPLAVVYDCMDELSAFKNAPEELKLREAELVSIADVVFTGGRSLYEAKANRHPSVHCFPSSIDAEHFAKALDITEDPADQKNIGHPRIGFFGVIDERTDIDLLDKIAELRPDWNFVMIGPVVKIDADELPERPNIHYLGGKDYSQLPAYISGWDAAMMPFALNESTRFISPTKTPEYLAAGAPVVSTAIRDVVRPYAELGLVHIAATPDDFVRALEKAMTEDAADRLRRVQEYLEGNSWDKTFEAMAELIDEAVNSKASTRASSASV